MRLPIELEDAEKEVETCRRIAVHMARCLSDWVQFYAKVPSPSSGTGSAKSIRAPFAVLLSRLNAFPKADWDSSIELFVVEMAILGVTGSH